MKNIKSVLKVTLGSLLALSLSACGELTPLLEEALSETESTASEGVEADATEGVDIAGPEAGESDSETGEELPTEELPSESESGEMSGEEVPLDGGESGEGFEEGGGSNSSGGMVDFSQYLGPQESVFEYDATTGAGSYAGERISFMSVVYNIYDEAASTYGQLYMVDNTQPGQRWDIVQSSGEPLTIATETLNGAPFVPVAVVMMDDTRVTFQHREAPGQCTNHTAAFDDSQFTIESSMAVDCTF